MGIMAFTSNDHLRGNPKIGTLLIFIGSLLLTGGGVLLLTRPILGGLSISVGAILDWVVFIRTFSDIRNAHERVEERREEIRRMQGEIEETERSIRNIEREVTSTKNEIDDIADRAFAFMSDTHSRPLEEKIEKLRSDHDSLEKELRQFKRDIGGSGSRFI